MNAALFATLYAAFTAIVVVFQLALAAGAPWGQVAMGGRYPGRFPTQLRIGALVRAALLSFLALIVLSRAGVGFPVLDPVSGWMVWIAVAISLLSLILNLITRSKWERRLWAPVALVLVVCSLLVALS